MKVKLKVKKSAAKRFRLTGSGKLRRRRAYKSHILTKKSAKRKRRLGQWALVAPGDEKRVRRMLGL
ncbi:MAG: 50S ribosomal protein L35 [Acidobacteriota bacterium]